MKDKLQQLKQKINVPFLMDKSIQRLLRALMLVIFFVGISGGGYACLKTFLIPYYQATQSLNQQVLSEHELMQKPQQNPDQWQQFLKANPSFYFTTIKLKAALNSICELYHVNLKTSQIHDLKVLESFSFKPGNLTITATTDKQIFALLQHLLSKLSGVLVIKVVKLHRNRDFNDQLLTEIKSAQGKSDLIEANIEFEWLIFKHDK